MAAPIVKAYAAWRPPQWAKHSAMVMVTVPAGSTQAQQVGATDPNSGVFELSTSFTTSTSYVFDAVLALEHDQTITKTHHPVQTGASVSSHAYIEPAQLVMYVLMSDVAGQYVATSESSAPYVQTWSGNSSKSVSAYQQMLTLQSVRQPLTITTRLRTYYNMLITKISAREDDKTITGARFRLEFEQLFIASTQAAITSTRSNDTNSTGLGTVNPQPVPTAVNSQFGINPYAPGPSATGIATTEVPLPPDLNNGTTPCVDNGVPGYLGPAPGQFTPQYPNSVTAVNVPGAGDYSSNVVQTNGLATGVP